MKLIKAYLVSLFIVFLHFAGQITNRTKLNNRFFFRWEPTNAAAVVLDLFLIAFAVALLALTAQKLVQRWKRPGLKRILDHVLLIALLSGILAAFPRFFVHHPSLIPVAWMAGMFVIGLSLASPRSNLVKYGFNLSLLFSPVVFILAAQMLTWESWHDGARTTLTTRRSDSARGPVFVFVFDGWSYPRSAHNGQFRRSFENVRRLCDQSIVFHQARSPFHNTHISLPRLIYQSDAEFLWEGGNTYWVEGDKRVVSTQVPSLFQLAKNQGFNTCLVGWFLPYNRVLGNQVDYCRSYCLYVKGTSLVDEMALAACRNLEFWTDPVSNKAWRMLDTKLRSRYTYQSSAEFSKQMFDIMDRCSANTFALFHVLLPHGPHVYNEDGTFRGGDLGGSPEDYHRTLKYLDVHIGEILEHLRAVGKFDDALIVMTSDHVFPDEQEPLFQEGEDWKRRVPLIIKLPGQESGQAIDQTICTNQLKPLFQAVFRGESDTGRLQELVQTLATSDDLAAGPRRPAEQRSGPPENKPPPPSGPSG